MSVFFGAGGMGGNVERHIGDDDRDGAAIDAQTAPERIWTTGNEMPGSWNATKQATSRIDLGEVEYIRTESLGGQDFKYIQLGEALGTLRALAGAGHPSRTGRRRQMKALIVGGPNRGQVVDMSNVVHTDSRYFC